LTPHRPAHRTAPKSAHGVAVCRRQSQQSSIVLDINAPTAREVLLRLIDMADGFVHNIRPRKLARLGFGPKPD